MNNKQNTRCKTEFYKKLAIAYKSGKLTAQQYKTIKGQLTAGDVGGAVRGLYRVMARKPGNIRESTAQQNKEV